MYGIVIDKDGFKITFVVLNVDKIPQFYELKDGETIIESGWDIANDMNKPRWDGEKWIDVDPSPTPIPIEPQKTLDQKFEDAVKIIDSLSKEQEKLKAERSTLAENVYNLTSIIETLVGGVEDDKTTDASNA